MFITIDEVIKQCKDKNKDIFTVFDLEFFGTKPQHKYGNLKQIAFIAFDEEYNILYLFDETFIDECNQYEYIHSTVDKLMAAAKVNFAWGCHQDLRTLYDFGFELSKYVIVDMQGPFLYHSKKNTLGGTYYKITGERIVGAHNALIDALYTYKLIKIFDFAKDGNLERLEMYAQYLLRTNERKSELNGLSSEDRLMLRQLSIFINSKCKIDAYKQLNKVSAMLFERADEGLISEDFAEEKSRYYRSLIKDIDNKK